MSSSDWISPTTKPSGCAESSSCIILRRGSVPIAENMSANFATCSAFFLFVLIMYFDICRNKVDCQVGNGPTPGRGDAESPYPNRGAADSSRRRRCRLCTDRSGGNRYPNGQKQPRRNISPDRGYLPGWLE